MENKNNIILLGYYGGDKTHALSAWCSTFKEIGIDIPEEVSHRIDTIFEYVSKTKKRSASELLDRLASDAHETPFEKSTLHFLITSDIASHIHLLKHRIGVSLNSECLTGDNVITLLNTAGGTSARYKIPLEALYTKWSNGRPHQNTENDKAYSQKRIKSMKIRVLNETTGFFEYSHIKDIYVSGIKKIYKITLADGKTLKCSENHRIYTQEGWSTLHTGIKVGTQVAINGVRVDAPGRPWTSADFFQDSHLYTRKEFAVERGIKYDLCKKWGYIFNASFKEDTKKDFKIGGVPWNKGIRGYTLKIGARTHNPNAGADSHFWRGGITEERSDIGAWTTNNARKVHERFNFTCQRCAISSGELVAHHIVPVAQDITKGKCFNNLITVCRECHKAIHRSLENEQAFAEKVLSEDFVIFSYQKRVGIRPSRKLKVHFSPIRSIEYVGEEETYDIEIEGAYKNFVANGVVVHNSARYKELIEDKFYIPVDWPGDEQGMLTKHVIASYKKYHECIARLVAKGYSRKRAKESARFYLPYCIQYTADVSFNFRSFIHFQNLRNKPDAQLEIQEIAQAMLEQVKSLPGNPFHESLKAFDLY